MTAAQFEQILANFPGLKKIKLQGIGEPLLNPDFFQMAALAKAKDIEVSTYTNASLLHLNDRISKLRSSGIDLLRISIDGGTKETFERIRPGSDFDQVVENVRHLAHTGSSLLPIIEFWTVVTDENVTELESIVDLAGSIGIETVNLQMILNTFSYKEGIGDRLQGKGAQTQPEVLKDALHRTSTCAQRLGIQLIRQTSKAYTKDRPCHWAFDSAFISVEGWVVPCCTIADPSVINMGNIFSEPFQEIWTNQRYQKFRARILANDLLAPCQNCYAHQNQTLIGILENV